MSPALTYVIVRWQPIFGLVLGILILVFFFYLRVKKQPQIVQLIAKYIFRNQFMAEKSAEGLFQFVTSFLLPIAAIFIGLAILYLEN
jgi:hypothetical protein